MFVRVSDAVQRARFNAAAKDILTTPPIPICESAVDGGEDRLTIVSQVQSKDLIPYLVAAKSFYRRIGRGRLVIVDDGSLTYANRETLSAHLPGVAYRPLSDGELDGLPRGGCWERLAIAAVEARDAYVIQLDADTVTLGDIGAVAAHVEEGRPFAIADGPIPGMRSLREIANYQRARTRADAHVQCAVERALDRVGLPPERRYLRGSAAFVGYPRRPDILDLMLEFSDAMASALGERWRASGTEQATSNYVVANTGEATMLVPPDYSIHAPDTDIEAAAFIHFLDEHRFAGGRYAAAARCAIADLVPKAA